MLKAFMGDALGSWRSAAFTRSRATLCFKVFFLSTNLPIGRPVIMCLMVPVSIDTNALPIAHSYLFPSFCRDALLVCIHIGQGGQTHPGSLDATFTGATLAASWHTTSIQNGLALRRPLH